MLVQQSAQINIIFHNGTGESPTGWYDIEASLKTNERVFEFKVHSADFAVVLTRGDPNPLVNKVSYRGFRGFETEVGDDFELVSLINPKSESWSEGLTFSMPTTQQWGGVRWRRERANDDGNWGIGYTALDTTDDLVISANNNGTQVDNIIRLRKTLS